MFGWIEQLDRQMEALIILAKMAFGWRPSDPEEIREEYWGVCPHCGRNDGYLNIRRAHWFVCDLHRIKWWAGDNLFSSWRHESVDDWRTNASLLAGYVETTDPVFRSHQEAGQNRAAVEKNQSRE